MRYLVASDIHGNSEQCKKLIEYYEKNDFDRMVLLGDLLYHGPRNDLPSSYDVRSVCELLNRHKADIFCVHGNCDSDVDQKVLEFPISAEYFMFTEGGISYFAAHGDRFNCGHLPPIESVDVLLNGHTHIPACEHHIDYIYCNPGSVGIPKGGSVCSFMIIEGRHLKWISLEDGSVYLETDL